MPILIVDLHELNIVELFEIQPEQIGDVEIPAFGGTYTSEINFRHAIHYFQSAVACEAVVDTDPAEGSSFRRAGTFEIFVERGLQQNI